MFNNNYFDELIIKIEKFIEENKQKKAIELINKELSMPYIPKTIEKYLIIKKEEINISLSENKIKNHLTSQQIIEYLNSKNQLKKIQAIEELNLINLRKISIELKKYIENNPKDKITIAFIFEALIDQSVDIDILIDFEKMNPSKTKSILEDIKIIEAIKYIIKKTEKQPQITELVSSEMKRFLLNTYPIIPKNIFQIADSIINIVYNSLEGKKTLSNFDKEILNKLK